MARTEAIHSAQILLMDSDLRCSDGRAADLSAAGWQPVRVGEFIDALTAVRSRRVDLVLLHLPVDDMVATDLPNILRNVAPAAYLPVIILADGPAERHRCRFLNSGADDVICTSISAEELAARIRAMLRIKDLHDQLAASRLALQEALRRERKLLAKLRRDNANLQALVTTDSLTHLQNRRSFREILDHEFKIARRYGQALSLLALDVDHFKVVNDAHGHPSGDYILKELAVILTRSVRESDVVARTGGEEFCILLPKADRQQARMFGQRIGEEVRQRQFTVYGRTIRVTISIGSATHPADAEVTDPEMLIYFADQALLAAKEMGRDRVVAIHTLDPAVRCRLRRQYDAMAPALEEVHPCDTLLAAIESDGM